MVPGYDPTVCVPAAAFEWAGVFSLADSSHTWSMQKVGGAYADASMRLVLVPTNAPTAETMEAGEAAGGSLLTGDACAVIEDGESMAPAAGGSCFELHVGTGQDSTFTIDTSGISGVAVYAQHVPLEFERDRHYLYDTAGTDIEPIAQESAGDHSHDHDEGGHRRQQVETYADAETFLQQFVLVDMSCPWDEINERVFGVSDACCDPTDTERVCEARLDDGRAAMPPRRRILVHMAHPY
jgi:hypothetical protein